MNRIALFPVLLMLLAVPGGCASAQPLGCQPPSPPLYYQTLPSDMELAWVVVLRASSQSIEVQMGESLRRGLWVSRDFGRHWQRTKLKLPKADKGEFVTASGASRSAVLYLWRWREDAAALFRSFDGGSSWQAVAPRVAGVTHPGAQVDVGVTGVADNGKTLYGSVALLRREPAGRPGPERFSIRMPGVYVSKDYGDTWAPFSTDLLYGSPVAVNDLDPKMIFGVSAHGLVRSTDGGRSWQAVGGQKELAAPIRLRWSEAAIRSLKKHGSPVNERLSRGYDVEFYQIEVVGKERAVLVMSNRGLFVSHDLGNSWCISDVGEEVIDAISGMAVSVSDPASLFVTVVLRPTEFDYWHDAREPAALYFSPDAGLHFQLVYESPVGRTKPR